MVTFNLEILAGLIVVIFNFLTCCGIEIFKNIWFEFVLVFYLLDFFLCESFCFSEIILVFLICNFYKFGRF